MKSDDKINSTIGRIAFCTTVLCVVGSGFMGWWYLIPPVMAIVFTILIPISAPAMRSAAELLQIIALNLYHWYCEDSQGCMDWLQQAYSLQEIMDVVLSYMDTETT